MSEKTQLYRHFDAAGELLYVGISISVMNRTAQHRSQSHWFDQIASISVEHFDTRREAEIAEAIAIREERPRHNQHIPKIPAIMSPHPGLMTLQQYFVKSRESQAAFAARLGRSVAYVSLLANGRRQPSKETAEMIAALTRGAVHVDHWKGPNT